MADTRQRKATEARRAEITDAAVRILVERGARDFTAKTLSTAIGVTNGALFRHFPSMEAIADSVVDRVEVVLFADFPPREEDPIERLGSFYRSRIAAIAEHPEVSRLLLGAVALEAMAPGAAKRLREFKRRSVRFVKKCLSEADEQGRLKGPAGPEEGAVLIVGAIYALAHSGTRLATPGQEALAQRVWAVISSVLNGKG